MDSEEFRSTKDRPVEQACSEEELARLIAAESRRQAELVAEVAGLLDAHDFQRLKTQLSEILKRQKKRIKEQNKEQRAFLRQFAMASRQNFVLGECLGYSEARPGN